MYELLVFDKNNRNHTNVCKQKTMDKVLKAKTMKH